MTRLNIRACINDLKLKNTEGDCSKNNLVGLKLSFVTERSKGFHLRKNAMRCNNPKTGIFEDGIYGALYKLPSLLNPILMKRQKP